MAAFEHAEQIGLHRAWYAQTPHGFEAPTVLALATGQTETIGLGIAVIPTYPYHPLVAARTARTLTAAAPGRLILGVSSGHRVWIENDYGLSFDRPIRYVTEWIKTVRRLLHGQALAANDNLFGITSPATDLRVETPIMLAATGPQLLTAAGAVADGVLTWMCNESYLNEVVVPCVSRGARQANREAPPLLVGVLICVSDEPEHTRAALRPRLAPLARYDSYRAVLSHPAVSLRPVDLVLIGTESTVRTELLRLANIGTSELIAVVVPDPANPAQSVGRAHRLLADLAATRQPSPTR